VNSQAPHPDERAGRRRNAGFQRVTGEPLSVILIGAGRRGLGAHVPALAASRALRLTAIVDTPERLAVLRATSELDVPMYGSLSSGLATARPDLAIVATPHDSHVRLAGSLLRAGIPTLVEKPPARNASELAELVQTSNDYRTPLATVLPLRYKAEYQHFARLLRSRDLTDARVDIKADVPTWPGIGNWRLSREHAGGGVLIDLGYHYLDLLMACLGRPESRSAQLRTQGQSGDAVEDQATVSLWFHARRLTVSIRVRSGTTLVRRSDLLITKNGNVIYSNSDPVRSSVDGQVSPESVLPGDGTLTQLNSLLSAGFLQGRGEWDKSLAMQIEVLSLVDDLYANADHVASVAGRMPGMNRTDLVLAMNGGRPVSNQEIRPVWPRVTDQLAAALLAQAQQSISIYDRSGIVRDFEDAFAAYVGVPSALATSSGTAALHSLYYGAGIGPGDEVICSDYGFFATVTPLVYLGAHPVLVDCATDGTISVESAEAAITGKTRAIMVTHMWGQPGRLDALQALCHKRGLLLFEDCSHAHGARFDGSVVGSFGDAAAWSLQAQKTVWAGEGGVLGTRDVTLFERALLLGHFNRRALQEIPESSPNFELAFTGTGLKYRAHPLALALALPQIETLDQVIEGRQKSATILMDALSTIPGIQLLMRSAQGIVHGYYALVALVDPDECRFDRELFIRALRAENINVASIPRQMCSMSHYKFFNMSKQKEGSSHPSDLPIDNSRRITATAVNFFVPSTSADLTDGADVSVVAEAIYKIGRALAGRS
jgi:perosamine synthetase